MSDEPDSGRAPARRLSISPPLTRGLHTHEGAGRGNSDTASPGQPCELAPVLTLRETAGHGSEGAAAGQSEGPATHLLPSKGKLISCQQAEQPEKLGVQGEHLEKPGKPGRRDYPRWARQRCPLVMLVGVLAALLFALHLFDLTRPDPLFPWREAGSGEVRAHGLGDGGPVQVVGNASEAVRAIVEALLADHEASVQAHLAWRQGQGEQQQQDPARTQAQAPAEAPGAEGSSQQAQGNAPALPVVWRAVDLEEQLLLVLQLRCDISSLLEAAHREVETLPAALPLSCTWRPVNGSWQLTRIIGFTVREYRAFVRCAKPDQSLEPGTEVSVAVNLAWGSGSVGDRTEGEAQCLGTACVTPRAVAQNAIPSVSATRRWLAGRARAVRGLQRTRMAKWIRKMRRRRQPRAGQGQAQQKGQQQGQLRSPPPVQAKALAEEAPPRVSTWQEDPEGGREGQHFDLGGESTYDVLPGRVLQVRVLSSGALVGSKGDGAFLGWRLVLESQVENEGVYLFAEGTNWHLGPRTWATARDLQCFFGGRWHAPALEGMPKGSGAVLCPHPPVSILEHMMSPGQHMMSANGSQLNQAYSPSQRSLTCLQHRTWPVTIKDQSGMMSTVAFYYPGATVPPNWRWEGEFPRCPVRKGGAAPERRAKRFAICSCTVSRNVAKFLREWTEYHAWMGVEHFFVYDNNSDDDLQNTAVNLSAILRMADQTWPYSSLPGVSTSAVAPQPAPAQAPTPAPTPEASPVGSEQPKDKGEGALRVSSSKIEISVHPWPWLKTQQAGFSHCALRAGALCEWVLFIDVDEFLVPQFATRFRTKAEVAQTLKREGPLLRFWLRKASRCKPEVGQIRVQPLSFGPSGQTKHPAKGVIAGYHCRNPGWGLHKMILRPAALSLSIFNKIHFFGFRDGMRGRGIGNSAIIFHYKFQAAPEYATKFEGRVARGVTDWKKSYKGKRGDGWTIISGKPIPPENWPQKFCRVNDTRLITFVNLVFRNNISGEARLPWEVDQVGKQ